RGPRQGAGRFNARSDFLRGAPAPGERPGNRRFARSGRYRGMAITFRAPRKMASTGRAPQNRRRMIRLCSRSDSQTFTPEGPATGTEINFSRCPSPSALERDRRGLLKPASIAAALADSSPVLCLRCDHPELAEFLSFFIRLFGAPLPTLGRTVFGRSHDLAA